ncbi:DEFA4 isoform 1, partial [Pongo abelii]
IRSLALLGAILLVALQARAEPLQAIADEATAQEQPGADDQEVVDSFAWDERATLQVS